METETKKKKENVLDLSSLLGAGEKQLLWGWRKGEGTSSFCKQLHTRAISVSDLASQSIPSTPSHLVNASSQGYLYPEGKGRYQIAGAPSHCYCSLIVQLPLQRTPLALPIAGASNDGCCLLRALALHRKAGLFSISLYDNASKRNMRR